MKLEELQKRAVPYLVKNDEIIATIDGQFFYTQNKFDALAHVGGKQEHIFLITKEDIKENKPKTEAQLRYEDRLAQLEPFKDLIDITKLKINTGEKAFENMLLEAKELKK